MKNKEKIVEVTEKWKFCNIDQELLGGWENV